MLNKQGLRCLKPRNVGEQIPKYKEVGLRGIAFETKPSDHNLEEE